MRRRIGGKKAQAKERLAKSRLTKSAGQGRRYRINLFFCRGHAFPTPVAAATSARKSYAE
jgi:hypothetical protein